MCPSVFSSACENHTGWTTNMKRKPLKLGMHHSKHKRRARCKTIRSAWRVRSVCSTFIFLCFFLYPLTTVQTDFNRVEKDRTSLHPRFHTVHPTSPCNNVCSVSRSSLHLPYLIQFALRLAVVLCFFWFLFPTCPLSCSN